MMTINAKDDGDYFDSLMKGIWDHTELSTGDVDFSKRQEPLACMEIFR